MTREFIQYVENTPEEIMTLSSEVLASLRANKGDCNRPLDGIQQQNFMDLGVLVMKLIRDTPQSAQLIGKLGPNEEAYGLNIIKLDGAALRAHFYDPAGANTPQSTDELREIDIEKYGSPHNHMGDISAVMMAGQLTHHCFEETPGNTYKSGYIEYFAAANQRRNYKYSVSRFVPQYSTGLEYMTSTPYDIEHGYWMPREEVHVVSWEQPTVTVFFNDIDESRRSSIYQSASCLDFANARQILPAARLAVRDAIIESAEPIF